MAKFNLTVRADEPELVFTGYHGTNVLFELAFDHNDRLEDLARACEEGSACTVESDCRNGSTAIVIKDGEHPTATFCIAAYGDDNGGRMFVTIPARVCARAFREAAEIMSRGLD